MNTCEKCGRETGTAGCNWCKFKEAAEAWNKEKAGEAQEAQKASPVGWRCPVCGRGHSPWTSSCPCVPAPIYYQPLPIYPQPYYPPWWTTTTIC